MDISNMFDQQKHKDSEEAPEHGLPGKLVAATIIAIVIACMLLSGYGNIQTWTDGLHGIDYWINFGTGIISEIIGAVLLVVIIWSLARPNLSRILVALLFFPVWGMATFQNATASWSYYVDASNADEEAAALQTAKVRAQALQTEASLAQERISEIKSELEFIGMTRTPDEIRAQRDRLPASYRTKKAQLTSELTKAERRIHLDNELIEQRKTLSEATRAGAQTSVFKRPSRLEAVAEVEKMNVLGFLSFLQTNRLGSLVIVMEMMKSFGLMLINVVFAGNVARAARKTQTASNENEVVEDKPKAKRIQRANRKEAFIPPNPDTLKATTQSEPLAQEGTSQNVVAFAEAAQRVEKPSEQGNTQTSATEAVQEPAVEPKAGPTAETTAHNSKPSFSFADDDEQGEDDKPDSIGIASKFV